MALLDSLGIDFSSLFTFLGGGGLVILSNFILKYRKQTQDETVNERSYIQELQNRILEFNNNTLKQNVELQAAVTALTHELAATNLRLNQLQIKYEQSQAKVVELHELAETNAALKKELEHLHAYVKKLNTIYPNLPKILLQGESA